MSTPFEQSQAAIRDKLQLFYRVFSTEDGHEVIRVLEKECFCDITTMTRPGVDERTDPYWTVYNEGMRACVLKIRNYVARATMPDPEIQKQARSQTVEKRDGN